MACKKNTGIYVAALLLFLGGVGYLTYSGFAENSVYFLNVSEARAATPEKLTAAVCSAPWPRPDLPRTAPVPAWTFAWWTKTTCTRPLTSPTAAWCPDTFKPGAEVIVEGGMGPEGRFKAKTLMTKCPSKYQKENRRG